MNKQSSTNTALSKSLSARQRKNIRRREKAKVLRQMAGPEAQKRWFFDLEDASLGPLDLGSLSMGSGSRSERSMVGLATEARNVQQVQPRITRTRKEDGNEISILRGTDLVQSIDIVNATVGDVLVTQLISPSAFVLSRLKQFSSLYQRYRFRKIRFLYEPIANATQSGQLLGYADFDVDNELLEDNEENLLLAAAHQGQRPNQIWQRASWDMSQVGTFTDLFTEAGGPVSDPRFSVQGVFYLIAASTFVEQITLGNLYIDYEVEFSIPYLSMGGSGVTQVNTFCYTSMDGQSDLIDVEGTVHRFRFGEGEIIRAGSIADSIELVDDDYTVLSIPKVYAGQTVYVAFQWCLSTNATVESLAPYHSLVDVDPASTATYESKGTITPYGLADDLALRYGAGAFNYFEILSTGSLVVSPGVSGLPLDDKGVRINCSIILTPPPSLEGKRQMLQNNLLGKHRGLKPPKVRKSPIRNDRLTRVERHEDVSREKGKEIVGSPILASTTPSSEYPARDSSRQSAPGQPGSSGFVLLS